MAGDDGVAPSHCFPEGPGIAAYALCANPNRATATPATQPGALPP